MTTDAVQAQRDAIDLNRKKRLAASAYVAGYAVAVQAEAAGVDVPVMCEWQRHADFWHLVDHERDFVQRMTEKAEAE